MGLPEIRVIWIARGFPMRFPFSHSGGIAGPVGAFLVLGMALGAQAQAPPQDDSMPPPGPPPQAVFQNRIPPDQMAFLGSYTGMTTKEIRNDKRFKALVKEITPRTVYHYGRDMGLDATIDIMLASTPLPVEIRAGRFVTIGSHGGTYLSGRGFLWFDLQQGIGLGGVYFHPVNGEPTPTLAIFSRQLKDTELGISQLPPDFQMDMERWSEMANLPPVTVRYLVPENGRKYVLLHDEDYCGAAPGMPAPPPDICQQMNADAADADMNGAYFMKESGNAANATAWRLRPDQVAWIGMRQSTCGAALGCRIAITRRRTMVLLRH
jgi:Lysozyme inhibitor LprI